MSSTSPFLPAHAGQSQFASNNRPHNLASDVWAKQSMISMHAFVVWLSHNCFKIFEMLPIFPVIFLDAYFNHILLVDIFWLGILGIVVSLCKYIVVFYFVRFCAQIRRKPTQSSIFILRVSHVSHGQSD